VDGRDWCLGLSSDQTARGSYPLPERPGIIGYRFVFTSLPPTCTGRIRLDANLSASSTVFGRYTAIMAILRPPHYPGNETDAETRNRFLTLSRTTSSAPTVVSTTRVSYSPSDAHYTPTTRASSPDPRYNFLPARPWSRLVGGVTDLGPFGKFFHARSGKEYTRDNDTNVSAPVVPEVRC